MSCSGFSRRTFRPLPRSRNLLPLWLALLILLAAPASGWSLTCVFVNAGATGAQTGLTWHDAFRDLNAAVAFASSQGASTVWVAEGVYTQPLTLASGVAVYGGFKGTETVLTQRDPAAHPTVIDVSHAAAGQPAAHAVLMNGIGGTLLDGFTVTGARASLPGDDSGGGILCTAQDDSSGDLFIAHCTITGNSAAGAGGGIYAALAWPVIDDCTITSNTAAQGGGLCAAADACPTLVACTLRGNRAAYGGAAALYGMGSTICDSLLRDNAATIQGGAVAGGGAGVILRNSALLFNQAPSGGAVATSVSLTLLHCTLGGNHATLGGALYSPPGAWVEAESCTFADNAALDRGGGVAYEGGSDPWLPRGSFTNCTFAGNRAAEGGALALRSALTLRNCVLSANSAIRGGALSWDASGVRLLGCTLADNTASSGGGAYAPIARDATFLNTIFSNNAPYALALGDGATSNALALRACLFNANIPGDYWDGQHVLSGAAALNALLPAFWGVTAADPGFMPPAAHTLSAPPDFDAATSQTTLHDATAALTPGALAGRLVALGSGRAPQALVLDNAATTLTVLGDWRAAGQSGASWRLADVHLADGSGALGRARPCDLMAGDIDVDDRPGGDFLADIGADEASPAFTPPPLVDTVTPVSRVAPLDPVIHTGVFPLTLFAADDSGLPVTVQIYYRFNGGAWRQAGQTMLSTGCSAPFNFDSQLTGGNGNYDFYSVATDSCGNVEAVPPEPDASTLVDKPFPDNCVYVDANASGTPTGEHWDTAFHTISAGIATARDNALSVVRVASGFYSENIQCTGGITIYGGYQSGTLLRAPLGKPTILCGVFEYFDPALQPSVVTMDGLTSAGLDGLVITGGANACGGGLFVRGGAGITINNCVVSGNNSQYAGGVWFDQGAAPLITNCRIVGNTATQCGGGLAVTTGSLPRLVNCLLDGNNATSQGGAVYVLGFSAPELIHCTVRGNTAAAGGAVAMTGLAGQPSPPRYVNTIFNANTGTALVELEAGFNPVILGCLFDSNSGGDYLDSGTTLLTGAAEVNAMTSGASGNFDGSPAFPAALQGTWSAAPVYNASTGRTTFTNAAAAFTPSALVGRFANPNPLKCLPALILTNTTTTLQVLGDLTAAKKNDTYQIPDDHLGAGSLAIDRVGGADLPATDLDGAPRPFDVPGQGFDLPGVTGDIGAYEAHPALGLAGVGLSNTTLDFGWVVITTGAPVVQTLTLSNPGTIALSFTGPGFQLTGVNAGAFTFVSAPSAAPLAPGATRTIQLSFTPAVIGLNTAILQVTTNDPAQPLLEITLRGTGVPPDVQITIQPAPQTVNPGATATFSVTATGTPPLSYQWKKDGSPLSEGGRLSGTQTATLRIALATFADTGYYACEVRNLSGPLLSNPARLVINPTLTVASAHGTPSPSTGPHAYTTGTLVSASLGGSPELDTTGTTRYLATGWTGTGSVSASGSTTQTSFLLGLDSLLTWQWKLQRKLTAKASPLSGGGVTLLNGATPADGLWFDDSATARIAEIPSSGWVFAGWSGDATGLATTASLVMTRPRAVTATFLQRPVITAQPAPQTVNPGASASFSVSASGSAPLSCQWKKDGAPLTNGGRIGGATLTTLTLSAVTLSDAGRYSCLVSNSAGSTESFSARLIVNPTLTVYSAHGTPNPVPGPHVYTTGTLVSASVSGSPELDTTGTTRFIATGWSGTGSVSASGATTQTSFLLALDSALTWQWKTQVKLLASANPPAGGQVTLSDGLTPANATWHDLAASALVRALPAPGYVFAGWSGDATGTATTASLVMSRPRAVTATFLMLPKILTQPSPQTVNPGANVNFSITATGSAPLSYLWKKDGAPLVNSTQISGATLTTLTLSAVTMSDAGRYSCLVTNSAGTTESLSARLIVNPTLTVTSLHGTPNPVPGAHVYTTGTLVSASVSGSPELDTTGTTRYLATGWNGTGSISSTGVTTQTSFLLALDSSLTWQWKTQVKLLASANPPAGGQVTLADGLTPANATWYDLAASALVRALPAPGYVFAGWSGDASGLSTTASLVMARPRAVTATFLQRPVITAQPSPQTVNPGATANFSISATGSAPLSYQWKKDGAPLTNSGHISGATLATLQLLGVTTADAGYYSCLVTNSVGSTESLSARLIVNPTLAVTSLHGNPNPALGAHVYTTGTLVSASVSGSPELDTTGTTRYLATGWLGTGSVPASGFTTSTAFNLNSDSALTWLWQTQYRLNVIANPPLGGRVTLDDGVTTANGSWHVVGARVILQAAPANDWDFIGWTGPIAGGTTSASLVMNQPLQVTAHFLQRSPASAQPAFQVVDPCVNVSFTVLAADLVPLSYHWKKDGLPLSDGGRISGATLTTLTLSAVTIADAGRYSCLVTNLAGTTESSPARLVVNPTLTVVSAHGVPSPALGAHPFTTGTLVSANVSGSPELDTAGTSRFIATGWSGSGSVPASGAATTVDFILNRDSVLTWQWKTQGQLAAAANPPSGGRITFADGVTPADGTWFDDSALAQIRAFPSPGWAFAGWSGDASGLSTTASLVMSRPRAVTATFLMLPLILAQPTAQTVNPGSSVSFGLSADGSPPLSYRWRKDGIPLSDDGHLNGATQSMLELTGVTMADAGYYSCLVTNDAGSTVSVAVRLAVNPTLTVASAHGSPSPSSGPSIYPAGTLVSASVSGSPELDTTGTTRYLATGWLGTGSVPASGFTTSTAFNLNSDSALTWQWKTQSRLAAAANPPTGGRITLADGFTPANGLWFDNPALARVIEIPTPGWYFAGWSGDASGLSTTASLVMSRPRAVTASFLTVPHIITQPTSQTVALGAPAVLQVAALGGAPLWYQWFKDGAPLSGETSAILQYAAVAKANEGDYACHVSNAGGYEDSWTAHLRVMMPAQLAAAPVTLRFVEGTPYAVDVEHGGQPTTQTLTLTNSGDQILNFTGGNLATPGLKITGAAAADYVIEKVTPATSAPLAPGASVEVIIRFAPAEIKRTLGLAAALTVTSDSPLTPSFGIPLLGDAVPVELSSFKVE